MEEEKVSKTELECTLSISFISDNLICAVNENGLFAVRNVRSLDYLSKFFSMDFTTCSQVLAFMRNGRICLKGDLPDGFARYEILTKTFLDPAYDLTFDKCIEKLDE